MFLIQQQHFTYQQTQNLEDVSIVAVYNQDFMLKDLSKLRLWCFTQFYIFEDITTVEENQNKSVVYDLVLSVGNKNVIGCSK